MTYTHRDVIPEIVDAAVSHLLDVCEQYEMGNAQIDETLLAVIAKMIEQVSTVIDAQGVWIFDDSTNER